MGNEGLAFDPKKIIDPRELENSKDAIYVWIDILGFSDKAIEKDYNSLLTKLVKFRNIFNDSDLWSTHIISDGILLKAYDAKPAVFKNVVNNIGELQKRFILENKVFVRGGIASGSDFKIDDECLTIITDGLSKAVGVESKQVDWPIIGITQKYLKELNGLLKCHSEETHGLECCYNKNGEKIYFIDFLSSLNPEDNEYVKYNNILSNKLSEFSKPKKVKILQKYIWLKKHYLKKQHGEKLSSELKEVIL